MYDNAEGKNTVTISVQNECPHIDKYKIIRYLAEGASAFYYLVEDTSSEKYALSICRNNVSNKMRVRIQEILVNTKHVIKQHSYIINPRIVFLSYSHPSIKQLQQKLKSFGDSIIIIVYEYFHGEQISNAVFNTNLAYLSLRCLGKKYCGKKSRYLNESAQKNALRAFLCIAKTLKQMYYKLNIYHFDIKPDNILIDMDFYIRIIDFGSAQLIKPNSRKTGLCSDRLVILDPFFPYNVQMTYITEATQAFSSSKYDVLSKYSDLVMCEKYDVYSLGCVLYYVLTDKHINGNLHTSSLHYKNLVNKYNKNIANLIVLMTHKDPIVRISMYEVVFALEIITKSMGSNTRHCESSESDMLLLLRSTSISRDVIDFRPETSCSNYSTTPSADIKKYFFDLRQLNHTRQRKGILNRFFFDIIYYRIDNANKYMLQRHMQSFVRSQSQRNYYELTTKHHRLYDDQEFYYLENLLRHGTARCLPRMCLSLYDRILRRSRKNVIRVVPAVHLQCHNKAKLDYTCRIMYIFRILQLESLKTGLSAQETGGTELQNFRLSMVDSSDSSVSPEMTASDDDDFSQCNIRYSTRCANLSFVHDGGGTSFAASFAVGEAGRGLRVGNMSCPNVDPHEDEDRVANQGSGHRESSTHDGGVRLDNNLMSYFNSFTVEMDDLVLGSDSHESTLEGILYDQQVSDQTEEN